MNTLIQQLMLKQFAFGAVETAFNALLKRSPHLNPILRKLSGKVLKIELTSPNMLFFVLFSEQRTDWLSVYEGEADCSVNLTASALPKLTNKQNLTALINDKTIVLHGDLQVLQHFNQLLDDMEKDPAELLSPFVGDVVAQTSTDLAKKLFGKLTTQFERNNQHLVDNLLNERPVLVHKLQIADFCDQVKELEQQAITLEKKFAKLILE